MIYRCILPDWAKSENPTLAKVLEGPFTEAEIKSYNDIGYNIYYLPNHPSKPPLRDFVDGSDIDTFEYVFIDMDLKEKEYENKDAFIHSLSSFSLLPTSIVDSGNGIHVYWKITDLDAMSFLKLQRRLYRQFKTDPAVSKIYQLMRVPGTVNTKDFEDLKFCECIYAEEVSYTCEQLDAALPPLLKEDEEYCTNHFNRTYCLQDKNIDVDDTLPLKFCQLLKTNKEIRDIWTSSHEDRSGSDWRLAHILFASGFSKDEAMSVLVNAAKALQRSPIHRIGYAKGIIDKIWTYELEQTGNLSKSVKEILARGEAVTKGIRFPCHPLIDDTVKGFRLGHVIGLVAGSGVGKTSMALNMFLWFTERNPEYDHFFVSLEQTDNEIAERWSTITQGDSRLHDKVHILSNYDEDGKFRHLSLDDIKDYILEFQKKNNKKIGTCVIDHIGALKKQNKNGENQAIVDICHQMKSFAVETNTLVIMQSQSPREKAGIGDLEIGKDAAYGTVFFESYVDYLLTIWQPLKRVYHEGAPTVLAFKFAKIRHKKQNQDNIKEDVRYQLFFDTQSERLRELTQDEAVSAKFFLTKATNERKLDRKTEVLSYTSRVVDKEEI